MTNVFQGQAYPTQADMLNAVAGEWLTAGGANSEADAQGFLHDSSDEALAAECMTGWSLDHEGEDKPNHMAREDYNLADLAAAFGRARRLPKVSAGATTSATPHQANTTGPGDNPRPLLCPGQAAPPLHHPPAASAPAPVAAPDPLPRLLAPRAAAPFCSRRFQPAH